MDALPVILKPCINKKLSKSISKETVLVAAWRGKCEGRVRVKKGAACC
jgi:hypothetical protein